MLTAAALTVLLVAPEYAKPLRDPKLGGALVAAIVTTEDGRVIWQQNSDKRVTPASNQKLLSNAFALWRLGPDYVPQTRFWKTVDGITIDAPGDPSMTSAKLDAAAAALGCDGKGTVRLRQTYRPLWQDTWQVGDIPNRYGAPVTAFTVDQGGFAIWAEKGSTFLLPHAFGTTIDYRGGDGKARVSYDPVRRLAVVRGSLPAERTRLDTLSIPEPDRAACSYFGDRVEFVSTLPSADPSYTISGDRMADQIGACLKPSDNNRAENMLLMPVCVGKEPVEDPYPDARKQLVEFLTSTVGASAGDFNPIDGSGLSRQNSLTVRGLAKLLQWADQQPTSAVWRLALAHPGEGTLKSRLAGVDFEGKTGTLNMVVALSGYVKTRDGRKLIVSVIVNHSTAGETATRTLVDQFVRNIANVPEGGTALARGS